MTALGRRVALATLCLLLAGAAGADEPATLAERIGLAVASGAPVPDVRNDLPLADAYRVQAAWVNARYGTDLAGYKAGLTNSAAQARYGIATPVLGVLPRTARLESGATLAAMAGLKVEVEVGVVVGADGAPAGLVAAVELPRLAFAAPDDLAAPDLIAANVSAYRFIAGPERPFDADVRNARISLSHDGVVVNEAVAADALGDPLASYRWLVDTLTVAGYPLTAGSIVLTGALGRIVDAEPGLWVAQVGDLGEVVFTVR
jgi:2-keto-4-pentenoate hydratase